jgi:hypothetical protein
MGIMPKKTTPSVKYENNPFFVAANGLTLLFDMARGVLIFLFILSIVSFGSNSVKPDFSQNSSISSITHQISQTTRDWAVSDWILASFAVFIVAFAVIMVSALFNGVSAYASARLARGKKVAIAEAFRVAFEHLWSFLWLQIIISVKLLLWTLLLVLPGVYMSFRYSLAQTAFFDEKKSLRGNAAIAESLRLTRGAWVTTFASNMLFNGLTFGGFVGVISVGVNAVLYQQFDNLGKKPKPAPHWLSWVTVAVPIAVILLATAFVISLVIGIVVAGPSSVSTGTF